MNLCKWSVKGSWERGTPYRGVEGSGVALGWAESVLGGLGAAGLRVDRGLEGRG